MIETPKVAFGSKTEVETCHTADPFQLSKRTIAAFAKAILRNFRITVLPSVLRLSEIIEL